MRHNSRGRKGGAPRPVMTSSGIRANANVVLEHANNPLHPHGGMRRPDEADAYYNNPYVSPIWYVSRLPVLTLVINKRMNVNESEKKEVERKSFLRFFQTFLDSVLSTEH